MRKYYRKSIAILLVSFLLVALLIPYTPNAYAKEKVDKAALLMIASNAKIKGMDNINALKALKKGYKEYYENLVDNPNLDEEQKNQILELSDAKISAVDDKIEELRIINRRKQRANSPIGMLGKVLKRGNQALGKGVHVLKNTVVRIIRNPKELLREVGIMMVTGGTSSFKNALVTVFKAEVHREVKKTAFSEMVNIIHENPTLRKGLKLKEFLGIEGNDNFEAALREYYKKKAEKDDNEEEETEAEASGDDENADEELSYDGEGGYDNEDDTNTNEKLSTLQNIIESNGGVQYNLTGSYTYDSINIIEASADQITAYEERYSSSLAHLNVHIASTPEAVAYELGKASAYIGTKEEGNGSIAFIKDGADIKVDIKIAFIIDLVGDYEMDASKHYTSYKKGNPDMAAELIMENLVVDTPISFTYTPTYVPVPWSVTCIAEVSIDSRGYVHVKGTYSVSNYIVHVVNVKPYYEDDEFRMDQLWSGYGMVSNSYQFEFVSDEPIS